jgi:hypothetical protein
MSGLGEQLVSPYSTVEGIHAAFLVGDADWPRPESALKPSVF